VPVIKGKALKWPYYCMELKDRVFFFFFEISKKTGLEREEAFSDWAFDLSLLLEARDIDSELVNNDDR